MNMSALIGIGLTLGLVALGVIASGSLDLLVDPVSILFVVLALPLHMIVSYSWHDIKAYGFGGIGPFLFPSAKVQWTPAESLKAARMANTAGVQAIYLGAAGTLIGTVQMLQALHDPRAVGPALSVAGLTLLYGLLMSALIFMPAARHHEKVALQGGAGIEELDAISPVLSSLVVLALIGLAVGISFLVMLLAMANWNF